MTHDPGVPPAQLEDLEQRVALLQRQAPSHSKTFNYLERDTEVKRKKKDFPLIYSLRKKETFRKYHSINKTCLRESYIIRNMPNKSHGKQSLRMKANLC